MIERYESSGFVPRTIYDGLFSRVILVSRERVAKTYKSPYQSEASLRRQLAVQNELFENRISVPQPHGIFFVPQIERLAEVLTAGVVMDFIPGRSLDDIDEDKEPELFQKALRLLLDEERKAEELGFWNRDRCNYNAIYDPLKEKIFIIDFQFWYEIMGRQVSPIGRVRVS